MGQPANNKVKLVNPLQWKEVIAQNTYICNLMEAIPGCAACGNSFKYGQKITRLETSQGVEYYHYDKCLKGVEIIGQNPS